MAGEDGVAVLAPIAERLRAVVEKAWADLERQDMYMDRVGALREAVKSSEKAAAMGKSEDKDSEDSHKLPEDAAKKPCNKKTVRESETRRTPEERPKKKARAEDCEDSFAADDGY